MFLLCIKLEFLFPSFLLFLLLLIVLVLLFFPGPENEGKGQLSEEGLYTVDKAFRRLHWSH